jgi:hypothetical protein
MKGFINKGRRQGGEDGGVDDPKADVSIPVKKERR